ncbi:hypothetical protein [Desulfonatronum parangueonense]
MAEITFETVVSPKHELCFNLPTSLPVGSVIRVTVEAIEKDLHAPHFIPQSELGRKLLKAREENVHDGGKLMDWDEINEEVRRRRGGLTDE